MSPFVIAWRQKALTTMGILVYWALGYFTLNRFDFEHRAEEQEPEHVTTQAAGDNGFAIEVV